MTRGTSRGEFYQTIATEIGKTYQFSGEVRNKTGSASFWIGTTRNNASVLNLTSVGIGVHTGIFIATATTTFVTLLTDGTAGQLVEFDNISVRDLPGNHEVAVSDTKRGVYGWMPKTGKRNLLTYTEDFTNAAWAASVAGTSTRANGASPNGYVLGVVTATSANGGLRHMVPSLKSGEKYTLVFYMESATPLVSVIFENGVAA